MRSTKVLALAICIIVILVVQRANTTRCNGRLHYNVGGQVSYVEVTGDTGVIYSPADAVTLPYITQCYILAASGSDLCCAQYPTANNITIKCLGEPVVAPPSTLTVPLTSTFISSMFINSDLSLLCLGDNANTTWCTIGSPGGPGIVTNPSGGLGPSSLWPRIVTPFSPPSGSPITTRSFVITSSISRQAYYWAGTQLVSYTGMPTTGLSEFSYVAAPNSGNTSAIALGQTGPYIAEMYGVGLFNLWTANGTAVKSFSTNQTFGLLNSTSTNCSCVILSGYGNSSLAFYDPSTGEIDVFFEPQNLTGLMGNISWSYDNLAYVPPTNVTPPVTPPVAPPVSPPIAPPVAPPVTPPVAPPVTPPVQPPIEAPVEEPVSEPISPPPVTPPPVTPPVSPPVTPPVAPPVAPPVSPPVSPPVASVCTSLPPQTTSTSTNFTCQLGVWTSIASVEMANLTINSPTEIQGNLTAPQVVFSGLQSTLNVTGCVSVTALVVVNLTASEVTQLANQAGGGTAKLVLLSSDDSNCTGSGLGAVPITLSIPSSQSCTKLSVVNAGDSADLTAVFTADSSSCTSFPWWIILVCVLGGIVIIVIVLAIVFTVSRRAAKFVRPYSQASTITPSVTIMSAIRPRSAHKEDVPIV